MDGAAHQEQQLQIQHDLERVLEKAAKEPLTEDDIFLLAWAAGIQRKQEA